MLKQLSRRKIEAREIAVACHLNFSETHFCTYSQEVTQPVRARKPSAKLIALIIVMSAIGNVLGLLSIRLPSAPGTTVAFHLSVLPSLLLAVSVGPLSGAITGFLSLIMATMQIGNVFIPFGNALFAGIAGLLANKFKFPPPVSGAIAVIPYAPYMWFACSVYNVPQPIIAFIIVKAFIEILISSTLVELILLKPEVKTFLATFKE